MNPADYRDFYQSPKDSEKVFSSHNNPQTNLRLSTDSQKKQMGRRNLRKAIQNFT